MIKTTRSKFDSRYAPYHLFIVKVAEKDYKVPHVMDDMEFERTVMKVGGVLPFGIRAFHFSDLDELMKNPVIASMPICDVPIEALFSTAPSQEMKLKNKQLEVIYPVLKKYGDYVLYDKELGEHFLRVDGADHCILTDMPVHPMHLKEAQEYIARHHRHCGPPRFHKFSVCLRVEGEKEPVGVAVASTPKARHLMDGKTLEINRVCVDPRYGNACSKLYAQVVRVGKAMGYKRFVTYTLPEESGSSLKAAGFRFDGMTQDAAHGWDSPSRPRSTENYPKGVKKRWILKI